MHKLEVQRSPGEGDGEQDDGVFFGQHAGRASKLGVGKFRCSDDLDGFRQVAENGLRFRAVGRLLFSPGAVTDEHFGGKARRKNRSQPEGGTH